jgi:hypothetical protein
MLHKEMILKFDSVCLTISRMRAELLKAVEASTLSDGYCSGKQYEHN